MDKFSYVPEGYHAITPAITFRNAKNAIIWYKNVFGATEKMILKDPSDKIVHAELLIGDSVIMVSDENPDYNRSPLSLGGNSVNLAMYVHDVDETMKKAVHNGARLVAPATDQFYGDRVGRIEDPFGYLWIIATPQKKISPDEMQKMINEMMQAG